MFRTCRAILAGLSVLAVTTFALAQTPVGGPWDGAIHVMGQDLGINVTFAPAGDTVKATISIPAQGAKDLALTGVKVSGTAVHFELPAGPGLAVFDGTLSGDTISGTFVQSGVKGTFDLKRGGTAAATPAEPPPPYRQEEVKITSGAITLAGTLTLPPSPGRHPAVVLITGSGAEDRDENIFGFKIFRVIADYLTREGIAVLRCDDRGVGGSTGKTADSTSEDFAGDVLADVAYLKARTDIDTAHIGLIGHSEGGLIAPMAATRSTDVAFIVLMSGPAFTGEKIMVMQGERLTKASGAGPDALARQNKAQQRIFDVVRGKATADEVTRELTAQVEAQVANMPEDARKTAMAQAAVQIQAQVKGVQSPWFRFFFSYDPAPTLAKVKCPVLALFGELDLQVPVDENKAAMEQIFAKSGNKHAMTKVLPKANHLYQEAKTGTAAEYSVLKKEFVPDLLPTMATWIKQQAGKRSN
jgi:uncharacterized protein